MPDVNAIAVILATLFIMASAIMFVAGGLMGKLPMVKAAVVMTVLAFVSIVTGRYVTGPGFVPIAVLMLIAMIQVIRYYEGGWERAG